MAAVTSAVRTERLRIEMDGAVQGVGFRPTVYRLTMRLRAAGWVRNTVAYLTGLSRQNLLEGQAAMSLERAASGTQSDECYRIPGGDRAPLIREMVSDPGRRTAPGLISAKFHNSLANWILEVACTSGVRQVVLSGGVFQNAYLANRAVRLLGADGFTVFTHRQVPANDGGLALSQAVPAGQPGAGS